MNRTYDHYTMIDIVPLRHHLSGASRNLRPIATTSDLATKVQATVCILKPLSKSASYRHLAAGAQQVGIMRTDFKEAAPRKHTPVRVAGQFQADDIVDRTPFEAGVEGHILAERREAGGLLDPIEM